MASEDAKILHQALATQVLVQNDSCGGTAVDNGQLTVGGTGGMKIQENILF